LNDDWDEKVADLHYRDIFEYAVGHGVSATACHNDDTTPSAESMKRFGAEFRKKHWPWPELPEVYYYPRSLAQAAEQRASLHAKAVVVDRKAALVTSANLTEAAQLRNIEAGLLVRYEPIARRVADYVGADTYRRACPVSVGVSWCRLL
jgi:phosphatidylserine/phosphatidylglycerophosphate/cardiolipin synthase-like enzyme